MVYHANGFVVNLLYILFQRSSILLLPITPYKLKHFRETTSVCSAFILPLVQLTRKKNMLKIYLKSWCMFSNRYVSCYCRNLLIIIFENGQIKVPAWAKHCIWETYNRDFVTVNNQFWLLKLLYSHFSL